MSFGKTEGVAFDRSFAFMLPDDEADGPCDGGMSHRTGIHTEIMSLGGNGGAME